MRRDPASTTIRDLMQDGGWAWAYCTRLKCTHRRPVAMARFAILWGLDASSDVVRDRLICARCGARGCNQGYR